MYVLYLGPFEYSFESILESEPQLMTVSNYIATSQENIEDVNSNILYLSWSTWAVAEVTRDKWHGGNLLRFIKGQGPFNSTDSTYSNQLTTDK